MNLIDTVLGTVLGIGVVLMIFRFGIYPMIRSGELQRELRSFWRNIRKQ